MVGSSTLMSIDDTLAAGNGTSVVGACTLMVDDGTLTSVDRTRTDDGSTLTSDGQHRLNSAIVCMTQHHCHHKDSMATSHHGQH
jgi:hypothetical protein